MRLTGGQMIADYLISEGVEYVFAVPGHGNTALLDAFVDRKGEITVLPAMHEQGAAHMADGYYRATGKIAVACTSIGPGATNTLTGVATAFADSMPFLLITGAVHTYMEGHGVLQEIDRPHGNNFPRMVEPVVKRWWQPSRLDQFPRMLSQALTPCSKVAADRSCWTSLRTSRPNSASTHRPARSAGDRTGAATAIEKPSPARRRYWRAPNAR